MVVHVIDLIHVCSARVCGVNFLILYKIELSFLYEVLRIYSVEKKYHSVLFLVYHMQYAYMIRHTTVFHCIIYEYFYR